MIPDQEILRLLWRWLLNDVIDAPRSRACTGWSREQLTQVFVAARYDIVTAAENWVAIVASSGSFDRAVRTETARAHCCIRAGWYKCW